MAVFVLVNLFFFKSFEFCFCPSWLDRNLLLSLRENSLISYSFSKFIVFKLTEQVAPLPTYVVLRLTEKVVPLPNFDSTLIWPPSYFTIFWQICKPRPLPFLLNSKLYFSYDLKNGLKRSLRSCSDIPIPLSRTVIVIWTSFVSGSIVESCTPTRITSLAFENLREFVSRFMITYCVRIISIITICSTWSGTKTIEIFWSSACLWSISTTFFMVKFNGWTAKLA